MNREGAETFLRLLAEAGIRGHLAPPGRAPGSWAGSGSGSGSGDPRIGDSRQLITEVARALIFVQALDAEIAEQILADFDLALVVREAASGEPRLLPLAARLRPGRLRFTAPPVVTGAGQDRPSPSPGRGRIVPVERTVPYRVGDLTGELHLMLYAHIGSSAAVTLVWRIRTWPGAQPADSSTLAWLFTVTDDQGQHYDLDFTGSGGPGWAGLGWLRPEPPPGIRWLDVGAPGSPAVRVDLARSAAADASLDVSAAELSAGEHLLTMIAERLMALAADFPQDRWAQPGPPSPGRLEAAAAGLGTMIAAFEAAEVLSPLSPVPGWLATICATLRVSGHGITTPPTADLPEPWLSLLAYGQRRKPDAGPVQDGYALVTATLPELDGRSLTLLGLHNSDGTTSLQALAGGLPADGTPGPNGIQTYFPLSAWIRDSSGRWHAVRPSIWHQGGQEYALSLRLVPPLPRSTTWIELVATARSAQVRVRLALRWGSL